MPWTSKLSIAVADNRMMADGYPAESERPAGSIIDIHGGGQRVGYATYAPFAVLTVTDIPDSITSKEWRRLILRPFLSPVTPRITVRWRDVRVILANLPTAARDDVLNIRKKAASVTFSEFLSAAHLEREARGMVSTDLTNPQPDSFE